MFCGNFFQSVSQNLISNKMFIQYMFVYIVRNIYFPRNSESKINNNNAFALYALYVS